MPDPSELDTLLRETTWLSRLARQLVARREDAEDLVQETVQVAWQHPPASGRSVRGWLRTILVNRWRDRVRSQRARVDRERAVRSKFEAPATVDVVAKAEVHRGLVNAVLALDEPYRTCVLLRFFENLPPRDIARQTGVPVATVHSRLQRALAKLREHFAEADGSRWMLSLAPLLPRRPVATFLFGVSIVSLFAKVGLGCAAVVVGILCWNSLVEPATFDDPRARTPVASSNPDTSVVTAAGSDAELERSAVASSTPEASVVGEPPVATRKGRVIDVFGVGIAGVALGVGGRGVGRRDSAEFASTQGGEFEFSAAAADDAIVSADVRWATVLGGSTRLEPRDTSTVIVAPPIELGGRVVDTAGLPLPGARVELHLPAHLGADLGIVLDYSVSVSRAATSDAHGQFVLRDVPAVAASELSATLGGYLPLVVESPSSSTRSLELVLERPGPGVAAVAGLVVDAHGMFVVGAQVSAGGAVSQSDERGAFTIDLSSEATLDRLVAVAKGAQPAVYVPERDPAGRPQWPARVMLRLGEAPLAISGRVLDRDGRPVAGAKVWIDDPLVVGFDGRSTLLAETYLGREDSVFWSFVLADSAGRFRIDGLLDRAYTVRALDPATLVAVTRERVQAGDRGVELHLTADVHPEVRGRVVARDGSPVAGVAVTLERMALTVGIPGDRGSSQFEWTHTPPVVTGAAGEFAFENVPVDNVEFKVVGSNILPAWGSVGEGADPRAIELVVDRRMRVQVELAAPTDRADEFRILDATGRPMLLVVFRGTSRTQNFKAALVDGRSQVLTIGEGGVTAVFSKAGAEVGRLPLQLQLGQVNTILF